MRIAIVINTSWNIYNFRMSLVQALLQERHEVVAIAPPDAYSNYLIAAGCRYVPIQMENKGTSPLQDTLLVKRFYSIYKKVQPDIILQYTIKPNIYGTLAAKLAGIPTINNVSGLGTVFIVRNLVSKVALGLYRLAFRFPVKVFFQNHDDQALFVHYKLVKLCLTDVLPGSGIDTKKFVPAPVFSRNPAFTFLMIARVLYEKGVVEYVEASRIIKQKYPHVRCQLLGGLDEAGNIGIKKTTFMAWVTEGVMEYLGTTDDVAAVILKSDCVVLPSYREGTPKTLLEAAALGKPIIATNVPGCKETVIDGENGYLCEVRNATDLAAKMEQVYSLADDQLQQMGKASRRLAVTKFDEQFVIDKYLAVINTVATKAGKLK
ncbi:glycosyltransferase family 1 protein [Adhaeribacter arboris]|uniref:Glycosyltransferase family 1 protein n=1 Tax=Adhaeribacter arboris TaxID=2072846 RepID=A0A2T2YJW7_9BACT|nr:glycosyltransferase family 4 protein [Adhaeribacter arboris]PSR55813.1 glycosyltransferase family 1 protein [Adhaeribacter arboris]